MYETLGTVYAITLYNLQIIAGITADAYHAEVYTREEALNIVGEQQSLLTNLRKTTQKILASDTPFTDEDRKATEDFLTLTDKFEATYSALRNFIENSSEENARKYDEKRLESYKFLAELLGL